MGVTAHCRHAADGWMVQCTQCGVNVVQCGGYRSCNSHAPAKKITHETLANPTQTAVMILINILRTQSRTLTCTGTEIFAAGDDRDLRLASLRYRASCLTSLAPLRRNFSPPVSPMGVRCQRTGCAYCCGVCTTLPALLPLVDGCTMVLAPTAPV